ncbi:MAG: BrnA antitoxin family protein [Burkholderiales bacterium]
MNKPALRHTLGSDLPRVDAQLIQPDEYEELPELTDEMFARAVFKKAGRPRSTQPKEMISLRLPPDVVARWRATGPGWQTRMAKRLEKTPLPRTVSEASSAEVKT